MPIEINGQPIGDIQLNGNTIGDVTVNGTTVFTSGLEQRPDGLYEGEINGKNVVVEQDSFGDWMCVMNYEHYGGTNPSVSPGNTFPQLPNGITDADDVQSFGTNGELRHVDQINQYGSWSVDAVRLIGTTENHNRKIKYFTEDNTVINAILQTQQSSEISYTDLQNRTTFYSSHTANLPNAASSDVSSNTNRIFGLEFPMYLNGTHHWSLGGSGDRWEVDDYPGGDLYNTVHSVWVRLTNLNI